MVPNDGLQPPVESFELKLPMVAILTFRASFGAIFMQQSDMLTNHLNKVVQKWHLMPSQIQRRHFRLVVDVDGGAMVASSGVEVQKPPFVLSLCTKCHLMDATKGEQFWACFFRSWLVGTRVGRTH
jgi:hypothetical protein